MSRENEGGPNPEEMMGKDFEEANSEQPHIERRKGPPNRYEEALDIIREVQQLESEGKLEEVKEKMGYVRRTKLFPIEGDRYSMETNEAAEEIIAKVDINPKGVAGDLEALARYLEKPYLGNTSFSEPE